MRNIIHTVKEWASLYEPVLARTVVAAFFQMLVGVGVSVGDWPDKVNAVLAFVTVVATLLAGRSIRNSVDSPSTVAEKFSGSTREGP